MLNRHNKSISPIGLDIGHWGIRAVQLQRHYGSLRVYSALEILTEMAPSFNMPDQEAMNMDAMLLDMNPEELLSKMQGQSQETETKEQDNPNEMIEKAENEHLRKKISRLIESGGFKGSDVVIHCPLEQLDMRSITLPAGPAGLPRQAVLGALKIQLADYIKFPMESAVMDYYVLDHDITRGQYHIMAVTANGEWIEKRMQLIQSLGLNCVAVEPLPCVMTQMAEGLDFSDESTFEIPDENENSDETQNQVNELVAIIDVGYSSSNLIVVSKDNPVFNRRFSLGGYELSRILSQHLMIGIDQAEQLKINYGLDIQSKHTDVPQALPAGVSRQNSTIAKTIFAAMHNKLDEYIEGLIRSLNYVITDQRGARLKRVLLSGSGSYMHNFKEYLSQEFGMQVDWIQHPLTDEIIEILPASRALAGSWSLATGLALSHIKGHLKHHTHSDTKKTAMAGEVQ